MTVPAELYNIDPDDGLDDLTAAVVETSLEELSTSGPGPDEISEHDFEELVLLTAAMLKRTEIGDVFVEALELELGTLDDEGLFVFSPVGRRVVEAVVDRRLAGFPRTEQA